MRKSEAQHIARALGERFNRETGQESFKSILPRLEALSQKEPSTITKEELDSCLEGVNRVHGVYKADVVTGALLALQNALFFPHNTSQTPEEAMPELRDALAITD